VFASLKPIAGRRYLALPAIDARLPQAAIGPLLGAVFGRRWSHDGRLATPELNRRDPSRLIPGGAYART